ncbi:MAG: Ubiquinone/menaquinone biosynthesis C-methyltransferase UbiE [Microgenomates bacterium OLB23]|nr:MAG: Ubiquinone/menaquinone biosynthesis C-methyltransferase UbiE [Microgenomates bacterium OLB23]
MDFDGNTGVDLDDAIAKVKTKLLKQVTDKDEPVSEAESFTELTPQIVAYADRFAVIQHVAAHIDKGDSIPASVIDALLARYFKDEVACVIFIDELDQPNNETGLEDDADGGGDWKPLTSVSSSIRERVHNVIGELEPHEDEHLEPNNLRPVFASNDHNQPIQPDQLSRYPKGIWDIDDEDGLCLVMFDAIETSSDPNVAKTVENALRLFDQIPGIGSDRFAVWLHKACAASPQSAELYKPICAYMSAHEGGYGYSLYQDKYHAEVPVNELLWNMKFIEDVVMDPLISALMSSGDEEGQQKVLRMVTNELGLAPVINGVRRYFEHQRSIGNAACQQKAEAVGRWLLGIRDESLPFHTTLGSVYQNIRFENYKPNIEAQIRDEALLIAEIEQLQTLQGTIVDLGCGTGRLSNKLSELGYADVIGLDSSEIQIEKAREGDKSEQVVYMQTSWKETGLPDSSAKIVYALGRSLPHTERRRDFQDVLREVGRIVKEGGEFFFDMPDPDKGSYLENRRQYLENMRAIGIPVDEMVQHRDPIALVDTVIDSPDGVNFYNRYVPSFNEIKTMLCDAGFEVVEVSRGRITEQDEAETVYFRAVKRPVESLDQVLARLAPTEPALSSQSLGDE